MRSLPLPQLFGFEFVVVACFCLFVVWDYPQEAQSDLELSKQPRMTLNFRSSLSLLPKWPRRQTLATNRGFAVVRYKWNSFWRCWDIESKLSGALWLYSILLWQEKLLGYSFNRNNGWGTPVFWFEEVFVSFCLRRGSLCITQAVAFRVLESPKLAE